MVLFPVLRRVRRSIQVFKGCGLLGQIRISIILFPSLYSAHLLPLCVVRQIVIEEGCSLGFHVRRGHEEVVYGGCVSCSMSVVQLEVVHRLPLCLERLQSHGFVKIL